MPVTISGGAKTVVRVGIRVGLERIRRVARSSRSIPLGRLPDARPRCVGAHSWRAQTLKYPPLGGGAVRPRVGKGPESWNPGGIAEWMGSRF